MRKLIQLLTRRRLRAFDGHRIDSEGPQFAQNRTTFYYFIIANYFRLQSATNRDEFVPNPRMQRM